ncbi:Cyclic di-GMP phosphodiesterase Gmr OS=Lysinibacillus sphaericus OX=1421 GN=gmr_2 PE=4 SV=1 [Lysinibacillus sphaericus]
MSREHHSLIGLDIFSLLECNYVNEVQLLFAKTIEGATLDMPKCLFKGNLLSNEPFYLRTHPTYFNGEIIGVHFFVRDAELI